MGVTILGHIFEQSISDIEGLQARAEGGEPIAEAKGKTTGKRKKEGVVYTPDSITRFIVEKTLGEYLNRRFEYLKVENTQWYFKSGERAGEFRTEKVELQFWRIYQDTLRKTRVVDPACGQGRFWWPPLTFSMKNIRGSTNGSPSCAAGQVMSLISIRKS